MILLDKLHYLLFLATFIFAFVMLIRIFFQIKNLRYSIKGVFYFALIAFVFPFKISHIIYERREPLINKINSDSKLSDDKKKKLKKIVQSRGVLYLIFTINHILRFPSFIENHITLYTKWYKEIRIDNSKSNYTNLPSNELINMISGKFSDLFTSLKELTT